MSACSALSGLMADSTFAMISVVGMLSDVTAKFNPSLSRAVSVSLSVLEDKLMTKFVWSTFFYIVTILRVSRLVIKWLGDQGIKIQRLSLRDILFGMFSFEDELYGNHVILRDNIARQYLNPCRCNKKLPRNRIFIAKVNIEYQLKPIIAKSNANRLPAHYFRVVNM